MAAGHKSAWAQYTITVKDRNGFQQKMQAAGVPTSIHYPRTMPDQPFYQNEETKRLEIPVARWTAEHVISLPMYPDMDATTQDKIISAVKSYF